MNTSNVFRMIATVMVILLLVFWIATPATAPNITDMPQPVSDELATVPVTNVVVSTPTLEPQEPMVCKNLLKPNPDVKRWKIEKLSTIKAQLKHFDEPEL